MKKYLFISLAVFGSMAFYSDVNAQCDAMKHKGACVGQLADGFTFIKSYLLDGAKSNGKGEIEYSFVFSKGTTYMLTIANNEGKTDNVQVTLLDPNGKELATNMHGGKYYPIGYACKTTGVHYMKFKFNGTDDECGLSVLGFKR